MKSLFPGYYRPTVEEFDTLWNKCIFVFDTNVLLNLYRYTPKTAERVIEVLERYQDRIWIPNRVALEFLKNRLDVISEQVNAYGEVIQKAGQLRLQLQNELQSYKKHAFIDIDNVFDNVWKELDSSITQLNEQKNAHPKLLEEDVIWEKITKLFDGRVGDSLTDEKLQQLYKEGEKRYSASIPPGYKDKNKDHNKYGDYIIWYEMKEFAKEKGKSIVFVTDDAKEDWWYEHKGKTIGPRPELINEITKYSNQQFYMYQPERFVEFAQERLGITNDETILDEIEKIQSIVIDYVSKSEDLIFYDFDRDGMEELVSLSFKDDQIINIYKQDGKNFLMMPIEEYITSPLYNKSISLVDIDNDGELEIACSLGWDNHSAHIFYKYHNGYFRLLRGLDYSLGKTFVEFWSSSYYDYDKDGQIEVVSSPWDSIPQDLLPADYIAHDPIDSNPWGYVNYVWRWDKDINKFRLIKRELDHIGGR